MAITWKRKKHLRARYGDVCDRTLERMIADGRLPPPEFPFRNRIPAWREDVLDAHDKAAAIAARPKRDAGSGKAA